VGDVAERVAAAVEQIRIASEAKGLDVGLRPPATEAEVDAAEAEYGIPFPEAVRAFYLIADGQRNEPGITSLLGGWPVASLFRARGEYRQQCEFWKLSPDREAAIEGYEKAQPEVLAASAHLHWWPFGFWQGSEMLLVDEAPTDLGTSGQLIVNGSHVFEAVPWVAPGLLELLEALVDGIRTGLVGLRRFGTYAGGTRWSIGPAGLTLELAGRALFDEPPAPDPRVGSFPPEWAEWISARGERFAGLLTTAPGLIDVPPGTSDFAPLSLFPDLQYLDLSATTVERVADLPDLPRLHSLVVRGVRSIDSIGRYPLAALDIADSPDLELSGLAEGTGVRLELDGPWSGDAPDDKVATLRAPARSASEAQRLLNLRAGTVRLELTDVDVADLDWSGCRAGQIDVVGGSVGSLDFVEQLSATRALHFFRPSSVDLAGLPPDTRIEFSFYGSPLPAHGEVLSSLHPPAGIAAAPAWWHAFGAATDPLIWRYFTGAEDGSEDQELGWKLAAARHEWTNAEYTRMRKDRGL
jgi:cell wall assembly regulator SMI1